MAFRNHDESHQELFKRKASESATFLHFFGWIGKDRWVKIIFQHFVVYSPPSPRLPVILLVGSLLNVTGFVFRQRGIATKSRVSTGGIVGHEDTVLGQTARVGF